MTTWFTSDGHIGHSGIIRLSGRPFTDKQHMADELAARWDSVVQPDDTVIYCGDTSLNKPVGPVFDWFAARAGQLETLTMGNHDIGGGYGDEPWDPHPNYQRLFAQVARTVGHTLPDGTFVHVAHMPYTGDSRDMERYPDDRPTDSGRWLIHGHVHEAWRQRGRMINVGVDAWNGYPVADWQIVEMIAAGEQNISPVPWTA